MTWAYVKACAATISSMQAIWALFGGSTSPMTGSRAQGYSGVTSTTAGILDQYSTERAARVVQRCSIGT